MSLEAYEARLAAAEGDPAALTELADELRTVAAPWAGPMRFQAIAKKSKLKPVARVVVAANNPLASLGLPIPTSPGTPLYRFRLEEVAFMQLEDELKAAGQRLSAYPDRHDCAKFVVWAAEWFRRKFDGGIQRWADLGAPIGLYLDHFSGKRLCKTGFEYWQLPLLKLDHSTEYLASIARQAGFPVAALDGGVGGWAQRYLIFIVGRMLGNRQSTFEDAIAHAVDGEGNVPQSWKGEELRVACAELAVAIVELRQRAEHGGAGSDLLVSRWLDENMPRWRDDLPISVDANSVGFIDGLMAAKPLKGGGGSVRASRALHIKDGVRSEYVVLHLNGTLKQIDGWGNLSSLSDEFSRLRLYAAGRLSDQLPGHLAIAEPEENGDWSASASSVRDRVQWPLVLPVEAELRGNNRRVGNIFVIPGGIAIGAGLRVWSSTDVGEGTLPDQLQLLGTGSGGFRSDSLWLDVPHDWTVIALAGSNPPELAHDDEQRRIWKVEGQAHVCTPQGDIFSVRPGQKSDTKDLLRLVGDTSFGLEAFDHQMPVFKGWPQAFVSEKGKDRAPQRGEIWWRPNGQREWQHLGLGQPFGATEFAWRDQSSGHLRAKAEAIILPKTFELNQERASGRVFLRSSEWGGAISLPGHRQDQSGRWIISIDRPSSAHVEIKLEMAGRASISLRYAIPMRAWIGKWTGGLCDTDSQIALTELHRHVARTEYSTDLMADLFDRSGKHLPQGQTEWEVSGELGMATLHDDISALIGPAGIDAKVKLNFNDGHENYWFVTQFVNELVREPGYGLMPSKAIIDEDVKVFGRFLGRPEKVEDLGQYTWLTNAKQRVDLPVLFGPWLIYLTKDGNALTRPFLLKGKELVIAPDTILGRAMVSEAAERAKLLQMLISDCVADPSDEVGQPLLRSIVALASALDDLPPLTFEIFGLLAKHSELMVGLVFACQSAAEIERVMLLERGLPFSWVCAPAESWNAAFQRLCSQLFAAFVDIYQNPEIAITKTKEAAREFVQPVVDFEPALEVHFSQPELGNRVSEIVGSFLDRSGDRIGKERLANPFRPSHDDSLHDWPGALHYRRAIDAPIVAAKAAKSSVELSAGQIACIKEIARRHPRYFSECYAAAIRE